MGRYFERNCCLFFIFFLPALLNYTHAPSTTMASPQSHIRVIARFRPLDQAEAEAGPRCARPAEGPAPSAVSFAGGGKGAPTTSAIFHFDAVLGEGASQADAFASVVDVVDGVRAGRSGSIIAYGA